MSRFGGLLSAFLLLLTLCLFTIPQYGASMRASEGLQRSWQAADAWMASAECARKTGVVLALCWDGRLVPFADVSLGDDPGHALALGIYSAATRKAITPAAISIFNSTVNYFAIVLLAVLFFHLQLPLLSFLVLTLGTGVANEFHALAPHPAQLGAACFAAILPIAILAFPRIAAGRRSRLIWIAVGILCLCSATLLRQAIGLMGVVASFSAVVAQFVMHRPRRRGAVIACAILIGAIFVSYQAPVLVSSIRNAVYHVPPATFPDQHGIWHNVYIGLGAVDNPFGIAWDDLNAKKAAERIDPTVTYLSARYFIILRDEYLRIVTHYPVQVAGIYFEKLKAVFETPLPAWFQGLRFWHAFVFLCVAGALARGLLFYRRPGRYAADAVLAVAMLFTAFFVGQGTLTHFSLQYLFPVHLFLLLWAGATVEFLRLAFVSPIGRRLRYQPVSQPVRE